MKKTAETKEKTVETDGETIWLSEPPTLREAHKELAEGSKVYRDVKPRNEFISGALMAIPFHTNLIFLVNQWVRRLVLRALVFWN